VSRYGENQCLLRDWTSSHLIEGGCVVFNAAQGRLYALNAVAGLTWLCIQDGLSEAQATLAIAAAFAVDASIAGEWFHASFETFQSQGLLQTGATGPTRESRVEKPPLRAASRRQGVEYQLLDAPFRLTAPPQLQGAIDCLLGSLRVSSSKQAQDEVQWQFDIRSREGEFDIRINEGVEASCGGDAVVAELERLLIQTIVPATPHLLTFHAAAMERGGRTFLLAGPSGAGKTTLSMALAGAGWGFAADEIVLLDRDLALRPLPFPPCLKVESFALVETWFPQLTTTPALNRYGRTVKYLAVNRTPLSPGAGCVIFLRYEPDQACEIEPLDGFTGLHKLLAQCVFVPAGFQHDDVRHLLDWHSRQRYFDMRFNACDAAVECLSKVAAIKLPSSCRESSRLL
jgi:hypothetical protein